MPSHSKRAMKYCQLLNTESYLVTHLFQSWLYFTR